MKSLAVDSPAEDVTKVPRPHVIKDLTTTEFTKSYEVQKKFQKFRETTTPTKTDDSSTQEEIVSLSKKLLETKQLVDCETGIRVSSTLSVQKMTTAANRTRHKEAGQKTVMGHGAPEVGS